MEAGTLYPSKVGEHVGVGLEPLPLGRLPGPDHGGGAFRLQPTPEMRGGYQIVYVTGESLERFQLAVLIQQLPGDVVLEPVRAEGGEHAVIVAQLMIEINIPVIVGAFPESLIGGLVEATPELTPRPKVDPRRRIELMGVDAPYRLLQRLVGKEERFFPLIRESPRIVPVVKPVDYQSKAPLSLSGASPKKRVRRLAKVGLFACFCFFSRVSPS